MPKYIIYEVEATGVEADNGADCVWYRTAEDAWQAVTDAMDFLELDYDDGECAWSGKITRREVEWEDICEVWEGESPSPDLFEQAKDSQQPTAPTRGAGDDR